MMKLSLLTVALCVASIGAHAQTAEFSVSGGPNNMSGKDLGSGYSLDNGWQLGFRLTLNTGRFFGHEVGYAYNRTHLLAVDPTTGTKADQGGMAVHQGFYDFLVYGTKEGSHIRPFVTGGGHFSNFVPPGASASSGGVSGGNKFGVNYGAGVKFRAGSKYLVRADFRQYLQGKPFDLGGSGKIYFNVISVGFGLGL